MKKDAGKSVAQRPAGRSFVRRRPASRVLRKLRPETVGCCWGVLLQIRLRSNRQPAAAPGRRAAPSRRKPTARLRTCLGGFDTTNFGGPQLIMNLRFRQGTAAGRSFSARRPAPRVPEIRIERALRRLRTADTRHSRPVYTHLPSPPPSGSFSPSVPCFGYIPPFPRSQGSTSRPPAGLEHILSFSGSGQAPLAIHKKTDARKRHPHLRSDSERDQLIFRRSGSWSGEAASISICSFTISIAAAAASSPLLPRRPPARSRAC